MLIQSGDTERAALLLIPFSRQYRDFLAAALAQLCRSAGLSCDVYYTAERPGGIFAAHGSQYVSGRHQEALARLLAMREVTVFRSSEVTAFSSLLAGARAKVVELEEGVAAPLAQFMQFTGSDCRSAVVIQTENLPLGLAAGVTPYLLPELLAREAVALPLEADHEEIARAADLGIKTIYTVLAETADVLAWQEPGYFVEAIDVIKQDDTYASVSFRVVERHLDELRAVDYLEPVLASYRIPASIYGQRGTVFSDSPSPGWEELARLAARTGQSTVFCRWGGGAVRSVNSDKEFIPLGRAGVPVHVVEPGRPVFHNLAESRPTYRMPGCGVFDAEPDDAQLHEWAREGKVLATIVTHSGELSHDDCVRPVYDLCAHRSVKAGIGVFSQRYAHEPDAIEPMLLSVDAGGVMELCEPLLHSAGNGICFEYLAEPLHLAQQMAAERERIVELVGEAHAPRGVYCYLDAEPDAWDKPAITLWEAIAAQGFEYVLSSVSLGPSRILYRNGDFIVLALAGRNNYPYSPFMRIYCAADIADMVHTMPPGQPGWVAAVVDLPVVSDIPALAFGDPYRSDRPRFGDIITCLNDTVANPTLVSATPHTIVRYARLLNDLGIIGIHQEQP